MCRNGRRCRLKIYCSQGRVGSSPTIGTKNRQVSTCRFFIHCESNGISSRVSVHLITDGVYHQPQAVFCFRNDDIQDFVLMMYTAFAVIAVRVRIHTQNGRNIFFVAPFLFPLLFTLYRYAYLPIKIAENTIFLHIFSYFMKKVLYKTTTFVL